MKFTCKGHSAFLDSSPTFCGVMYRMEISFQFISRQHYNVRVKPKNCMKTLSTQGFAANRVPFSRCAIIEQGKSVGGGSCALHLCDHMSVSAFDQKSLSNRLKSEWLKKNDPVANTVEIPSASTADCEGPGQIRLT